MMEASPFSPAHKVALGLSIAGWFGLAAAAVCSGVEGRVDEANMYAKASLVPLAGIFGTFLAIRGNTRYQSPRM